ncbi:MAG: hypothetical protein JWL64_1755, partial [Frankiales bacterium]|nr:hypothetical protein [Frankiales bacterium]
MPSPDALRPAAADEPLGHDPHRAWWAAGDDRPGSPAA